MEEKGLTLPHSTFHWPLLSVMFITHSIKGTLSTLSVFPLHVAHKNRCSLGCRKPVDSPLQHRILTFINARREDV